MCFFLGITSMLIQKKYLDYDTKNLQSSLENLNAAISDVRSGIVKSKPKLTRTQRQSFLFELGKISILYLLIMNLMQVTSYHVYSQRILLLILMFICQRRNKSVKICHLCIFHLQNIIRNSALSTYLWCCYLHHPFTHLLSFEL